MVASNRDVTAPGGWAARVTAESVVARKPQTERAFYAVRPSNPAEVEALVAAHIGGTDQKVEAFRELQPVTVERLRLPPGGVSLM